MITRIGDDYKFRASLTQKPINKHADVPKSLQFSPRPVMQYYDYSQLIQKPLSFKGLGFDETIEYNYFQLPIVKNQSGQEFQAMPDKTQLAAARSLYNGDNTVCIAPTGTGKTAIANYVITRNLEKGKKTYYTTPLKALSNDKYREFCKIYGEENVGLLTGDIKLKKDAPVLIMTTEIFRNMALSNYANPQKRSFRDVQTVVFDEAHYINEPERGKIWEESIMLAPKNIQILPLTATIGNASQFSSWIESITGKQTNLVEASPKDRYVPLVYYNYNPKKEYKFHELIRGKVNIPQIAQLSEEGNLSERQARALSILEEKEGLTREEVLNKLKELTRSQPTNHSEFAKSIRSSFKLRELAAQEITQLLIDSDTKKINEFSQSKELKKRGANGDKQNGYGDLIRDLRDKEKLPAIIFKFSRAGCNQSAKDVSGLNLELTTDDEKAEISKVIKNYTDAGIYLGKNFNPKHLLNGVATHNAGLMPGYKKLVEELFSRKLLKVVFATSTLSAGINMPARTVVITQLEKPTGEKGVTEPLSANEFHQMSGRAGRRSVDTIGNVVLYDLNIEDQELAEKLILQKADPITSKYGLNYNFLTSYYQQSNNDERLNEFVQKTLKISQAGEKKAEVSQELMEEIETHKKTLVDLGFLEELRGGHGATLKGEMLSKVHGYNEITLVEMIKNKNLKDLNAAELAGFAASAVSSHIDFEDEVSDLIGQLVVQKCNENSKFEFLDVLSDADDYDSLTESAENKNGIVKNGGGTDIFSAYVGYTWASSNLDSYDKENSIEAFKNLLSDPDARKNEKHFPNFNFHPFNKVFEGDLYNIISQSVDVLKQIINICEFALEKPELDGDHKYYSNLLKTAQKSVELVKLPPIHDSLSVA